MASKEEIENKIKELEKSIERDLEIVKRTGSTYDVTDSTAAVVRISQANLVLDWLRWAIKE